MNHFTDSQGNKISKGQIDRKIRNAKIWLLQRQLNEHGFNFCEECNVNSSAILDCSHIVSTDRCQKDPNIALEMAWDLDNLRVLCRKCHMEHDAKSTVETNWLKYEDKNGPNGIEVN